MIFSMAQKFKIAVELPIGWHKPMADRVFKAGKGKGLGRYIWAYAGQGSQSDSG